MKVINSKVHYDRINEMVVGPKGARQIATRFEILACAAEHNADDYGYSYGGEFVPIESIEIGDEVLYKIFNEEGQRFVDVVNVASINEDKIVLCSANITPGTYMFPIIDKLIFKLSDGIYGWDPEWEKPFEYWSDYFDQEL